jgi:hypothetical protein
MEVIEMVEIGTIEATLKLNSSEFTAGIEGAESSLKGFAGSAEQAANTVSSSSTKMGNDTALASDKTATGMESSSSRVATSAATTGGSMKMLGLGFSQTATSAFSLFQSFDNIEKKQYAVEKANLAVDKSEVSLKKAQDEYNDAVTKYGVTSQEAEAAATKLQIATDANDLANERARLSQNSLNDSMTMAALTVIPSVISGIDGMSKVWKNLQGLDVIGHLKGITSTLGGNKMALASWGAGIAAVAVVYAAFTTKSEDTRIMLSLLAGGLVAAAAAQWIWNAAAAFTIGLTGVGIALIAVAAAAAASVYLLSSTYGSSTSGEVASSTAAAASNQNIQTSQPATQTTVTSTMLINDIYGNGQTVGYLRAHPEMQRHDYHDTSGMGYDFESYVALDENLRAYARGGLAMTPQVAKIAEKEPEFIIPESKMAGMGGTTIYNVFNINGGSTDEIMDRLAQKFRAGGINY